MAFLIIGGLELITYFLFGIGSFESQEVFVLIWGLLTTMFFIKSVFNISTYDMNRMYHNNFNHVNDDIYKAKNIYATVFDKLQYFLLVLVNVGLYFLLIHPHY